MRFKSKKAEKEWNETVKMFRERSKQKPDGSGSVFKGVVNSGIADFVELWAHLMEKEVTKGKMQ